MIYLPKKRTIKITVSLLFCAGIMLNAGSTTLALPQQQKRLFNLGLHYVDYKYEELGEGAAGGAGGSGGGEIPGNCPEEQVYNFFKTVINSGLSDVQIASIMGNLEHESGIDPTRIQGQPEGEGSQDPNASGALGWGLMQWTPGSRVPGLMQQAGILGEVYLLRSQLDLVWWHLNNTSPTGRQNVIEGFRNQTSLRPDPNTRQDGAVVYFELYMEGAGTKAYPSRWASAERYLNDASTRTWCD